MEKKIASNCLLCNKSFGWKEVVIGKMPENVWFCMDCSKKFNDDNKYEGIFSWIVIEYETDIILEYK